ncbi:MAG: NrfD/PsrC family molybdoenzyme membrane anchor subunit [Acidilobaceae archaeon]
MKRLTLEILSILAIIIGLILIVIGFTRIAIHEISWGSLVVGYTIFAIMASGSSVVNSIYALFGYRGPKMELVNIVKLGVLFSIATLISAFLMIFADVSRPLDFWKIYVYFNVDSRIAWMTLLYTILLIFLIVELVFFIRVGSIELVRPLKWIELVIAALVLITTILATSNLAQVYGSIIAIPGWYGLLAPYFIATAILLGASGQALFIMLTLRGKTELIQFLSRYYGFILALMLPILAFFLLWNIVTARYSIAWLTYSEIVTGVYSLGFWVVVVVLGIIAPFILALYSFTTGKYLPVILASILVLITSSYNMYLQIIVHQLKALEPLAGVIREASYTITGSEILIILGSIIIWPALYVLAIQLLPLMPGEKPSRLYIFK